MSLLLSRAPGIRVAAAGAAARLPADVLARTHVAHLIGDEPVVGLPAVPTGEVAGRLDGHTLRSLGSSFELPWPGRAMAENALLVLATAWLLGVDPRAAFERI